MYSPATRLLTTLELLQVRDHVSGTELAERLDVDPRSVRRYVTMLQDLGIPVEAVRGRYGAYRLRPGFKLPPLMFSEEEAVALTVGLLLMHNNGVTVAPLAIQGALAKVQRVLPVALQERVHILQQVLEFAEAPLTANPPTDASSIVRLSSAAYDRVQLRLTYASQRDEMTERVVDPYGVVQWAGRWYVVGYCHTRAALRVFRVDRIGSIEVLTDTFVRPDGFDCHAHVVQAMIYRQTTWDIAVVFETTLAEAQKRIHFESATLETRADGVLFRIQGDDLRQCACFVVGLGWRFRVVGPPELQTAISDLADEIGQMARQPLG